MWLPCLFFPTACSLSSLTRRIHQSTTFTLNQALLTPRLPSATSPHILPEATKNLCGPEHFPSNRAILTNHPLIGVTPLADWASPLMAAAIYLIVIIGILQDFPTNWSTFNQVKGPILIACDDDVQGLGKLCRKELKRLTCKRSSSFPTPTNCRPQTMFVSFRRSKNDISLFAFAPVLRLWQSTIASSLSSLWCFSPRLPPN